MKVFLALVLLGSAAMAQDKDKPHIDVVFCIDCSGSMGPVIETAKQKVWSIVNEIAKARPTPVLRIGLIGYGDADRQFRKFDLSDDLDEVYKNLMTFKDEGWGHEWVGLVIHKATEEMKWSESKQALKVIYVVGNETAKQGPMDYTKTAPAAIKKDIIVNAIYCGDYDYGTATPTWKEFAKLADGQYTEIAATGGTVSIATPYDKEIEELSRKLNGTYIAFGTEGRARLENQAEQDKNAAQTGGAADRALAKCAAQYNNARWDLVDACKDEKFDWTKLKDEELPHEMRTMTLEERKAYVEKKAKERAEIQSQIKELSAKRGEFIKEEMKKQGLKGDKAFDEAVRKTLTEQAEKKGFQFAK